MTPIRFQAADLGVKLDDLWDAERCSWHFDFDGGAGTNRPWTLILEWTQESDNQHHADWTTHSWIFYGATVEEALTDAIEWCEGLLPFERCGGCDGEEPHRSRCEDCGGTGLASRSES